MTDIPAAVNPAAEDKVATFTRFVALRVAAVNAPDKLTYALLSADTERDVAVAVPATLRPADVTAPAVDMCAVVISLEVVSEPTTAAPAAVRDATRAWPAMDNVAVAALPVTTKLSAVAVSATLM